MGTVGGNLFAPTPFGDFTVALLALDATVAVQGGYGARDVPIEEFLAGRDRQQGTLVLAVSCQRPPARGLSLSQNRARQAERRVGDVDRRPLPNSSGRVVGARIAFGAMGPTAVRAKAAERALEGRTLDEASIAAAAAAATEGTSPATDAIASAWYRREVVGVHLRRLLPGRNKRAIGKPMAKTALQFRHNGREVAVFVDGGTNLLTRCATDRRHAPKFGCGQGGCGACTVLIDGEPHLSCLTLAETVAGRSIETPDGIKNGPEPASAADAPSWSISPRNAAIARPGMLMAAKALLDRNPSPSRAEVVEAIAGNICRCTGYEPIINAILAAAAGAARARLKDSAMLELRKDIFADERDDNLKEIGKGTQRQDMLGHVTGDLDLFQRSQIAGHAASESAAQPARACAHPAHRRQRGRASARRAPRSFAAPTCRAISTRCSA